MSERTPPLVDRTYWWTQQQALDFLNELRYLCPISEWRFCLDSDFLLHGTPWNDAGGLPIHMIKWQPDATFKFVTTYLGGGTWVKKMGASPVYCLPLTNGRQVCFIFPLEGAR